MRPAFTADQIRAAEHVLLAQETHPDELMQCAAAHVSAHAQLMVPTPTPVLVLAGSGGNGGDGLYAGALLAQAGYPVSAVLLGRGGRVHTPALQAFRAAGGRVLADLGDLEGQDFSLIIDAILGLSPSPTGLDPAVLSFYATRPASCQLLAVDLPSGLNPDTGRGESYPQVDRTVSFGGMRRAHCLNLACGEIFIEDIAVSGYPRTLGQLLNSDRSESAGLPASPTFTFSHALHSPVALPDPEPKPEDNKYSGGVVGICAGSATYPGAALLSCAGALHATASMVRFVGAQAASVVQAHPEIVAVDTLGSCARTDFFVHGPGRGTQKRAAAELSSLLSRPQPLLIDADSLTLLTTHPELREQLRHRETFTLLTPHSGEFARLIAAQPDSSDSSDFDLDRDPVGAVSKLSAELGVALLLKGRHTIITHQGHTHVLDAGSSWAATAGSGDVLAGILGAWLARYPVTAAQPLLPIIQAATLHAHAAYLSALTPAGPAPTTASKLAAHISLALAKLSRP